MLASRPHSLLRSAQTAGFITGCVLLIPFIGAQITEDWQWTALDFVFAGVLVFATGMVFSLIARRSGHPAYRAGLAIAVFAGFVLLWANLAVGIVGEPDDRWNLLYYGVLAAGGIVAVASRFRPSGMALAALTTAIGLGGAATIVIIGHPGAPTDPRVVAIANALFVAAFLVAAALFQKSADAD